MLEIKGLDEFQKSLEELSKRVKDLDEHEVSFEELFTRQFMIKYTNFSSFDELLKAGNYVVNSQEDFEAIPEDKFDEHIKAVTNFSHWQDMLDKAAEIWTEKQLFD